MLAISTWHFLTEPVSIFEFPILWLPMELDRNFWVEKVCLGVFWGSAFYIIGYLIFRKHSSAGVETFRQVITIILTIILMAGLPLIHIVRKLNFPSSEIIINPANTHQAVQVWRHSHLQGGFTSAVLIRPGINYSIGLIADPRDHLPDAAIEFEEAHRLQFRFVWSEDGCRLVVARFGWYANAWDFYTGKQWTPYTRSMEEVRDWHSRFEKFLQDPSGMPLKSQYRDIRLEVRDFKI